jgi:hypothetical protein
MLGVGSALYNLTMQSYRQAITPEGWEGRTSGSMRFITWGTLPLGGLLGGLCGEWLGLQPTLLIAGLGGLAACGWLVFTPLHTIRTQPTERPPVPASQ